jgi:hypothetical protein
MTLVQLPPLPHVIEQLPNGRFDQDDFPVALSALAEGPGMALGEV